MKINNIKSFNPSFGYISKRAVDMILRQMEGTANNDKTHYPRMDFENLDRLHKLVKRASELKKSVIDTSGNNWEEMKAQQIVVRSHCYGGGDRSNIAVFAIPRVSLFDSSTNNPREIMDTLENAVSYAEDAEDDPTAHDIFDEYGWHGGVREDKSSMHIHDNMKSNHKDSMLDAIYGYTLNLRSIK